MNFPRPFRVHKGRAPEEELRKIQDRFRVIRDRADRREKLRRLSRKRVNMWPMTIIGTVALYLLLASFLPWLPSVTLQSGPYYPNCDAARAAGAAPIYHGQPGYRPPLDSDDDGIACEPLR